MAIRLIVQPTTQSAGWQQWSALTGRMSHEQTHPPNATVKASRYQLLLLSSCTSSSASHASPLGRSGLKIAGRCGSFPSSPLVRSSGDCSDRSSWLLSMLYLVWPPLGCGFEKEVRLDSSSEVECLAGGDVVASLGGLRRELSDSDDGESSMARVSLESAARQ